MGYIYSKCIESKTDEEPVIETPDNSKKLNNVSYTKTGNTLQNITLENNSMRLARVENKNYFNYSSEQRLSYLEHETYSKFIIIIFKKLLHYL